MKRRIALFAVLFLLVLLCGCTDILDKIGRLENLDDISYSMVLNEPYPDIDLNEITKLPVFWLAEDNVEERRSELYLLADALGIEGEPDMSGDRNSRVPPLSDDWEALNEMPRDEASRKYEYSGGFINMHSNIMEQYLYAYRSIYGDDTCGIAGIDYAGFEFTYDEQQKQASITDAETERLRAVGEKYINEHRDILADASHMTYSRVYTVNRHSDEYNVSVRFCFREGEFSEPSDIILNYCKLKKGVDILFSCQDDHETYAFSVCNYPADKFALVDTVGIIPYETAVKRFDEGNVNYEGGADISSTRDYSIYLIYVADKNNIIRPVYVKQENGRIGEFTGAAWIDALSS